MIKITLALLAATVSLAGTPAFAKEAYQVSVTKTATDTYKIDGRQIQINTKSCLQSAAHTQSILLVDGESGTLVFDAKTKCAVNDLTKVGERKLATSTAGPAMTDFIKISQAAKLAARDVLFALN